MMYAATRFLMNQFKAILSDLEYPLTITGRTKRYLNDYTIYGNSVQDGEPTPDAPVEVQSVGDLVTDETDVNYGKYKIPVTARGKNLLNLDEGLNDFLKKNSDGSYTQEITSSGTRFSKYINLHLKAGIRYVMTLKTIDRTTSGTGVLSLQLFDANGNATMSFIYNTYHDSYGGSTYTPTVDVVRARAYITAGYTGLCTISDVQIEVGNANTSTEYEPYIEPVTADIYLDEPLAEGESINYRSNSLPPLPQFKGTTVYETETTISPSGIQVKYY